MPEQSTYGPRRILTETDVWDWSDLGGNSLTLRATDSGDLTVSAMSGEADSPVSFRVASVDRDEMVLTLVSWLTGLRSR